MPSLQELIFGVALISAYVSELLSTFWLNSNSLRIFLSAVSSTVALLSTTLNVFSNLYKLPWEPRLGKHLLTSETANEDHSSNLLAAKVGQRSQLKSALKKPKGLHSPTGLAGVSSWLNEKQQQKRVRWRSGTELVEIQLIPCRPDHNERREGEQTAAKDVYFDTVQEVDDFLLLELGKLNRMHVSIQQFVKSFQHLEEKDLKSFANDAPVHTSNAHRMTNAALNLDAFGRFGRSYCSLCQNSRLLSKRDFHLLKTRLFKVRQYQINKLMSSKQLVFKNNSAVEGNECELYYDEYEREFRISALSEIVTNQQIELLGKNMQTRVFEEFVRQKQMCPICLSKLRLAQFSKKKRKFDSDELSECSEASDVSSISTNSETETLLRF